MKCFSCPTTVQSVDEAIAADWLPTWWDGAVEKNEPICCKCQKRLLKIENGLPVLRELSPISDPFGEHRDHDHEALEAFLNANISATKLADFAAMSDDQQAAFARTIGGNSMASLFTQLKVHGDNALTALHKALLVTQI